jgi:hypothetical protein
MDLWRFKPGDTLVLDDGERAEVRAPTEDGHWIRVCYEDGTEDLVAEHKVSAFAPARPGPEWGDRVVVVLHHVPESEESEEGYEATTLTGVPLGAIVTYSDAASARAALEGLLGTLRTFGYSGAVTVEDATEPGGNRRYEVAIS